jgi:hypothetical protein
MFLVSRDFVEHAQWAPQDELIFDPRANPSPPFELWRTYVCFREVEA